MSMFSKLLLKKTHSDAKTKPESQTNIHEVLSPKLCYTEFEDMLCNSPDVINPKLNFESSNSPDKYEGNHLDTQEAFDFKESKYSCFYTEQGKDSKSGQNDTNQSVMSYNDGKLGIFSKDIADPKLNK